MVINLTYISNTYYDLKKKNQTWQYENSDELFLYIYDQINYSVSRFFNL